jgi:hypothetical protein
MDDDARVASDSEEWLEIELTDLREARDPNDSRPGAVRSPLSARLTGHGRMLRVTSAILAVTLALAVTLGGAAAVRAPMLALLASLPRSATPRPTVNQKTFTWSQVIITDDTTWTTLRQRPLHLPTLDPGSPCPAMPGQRFSQAYGAGLGVAGGPVYALAPGAADGALRYAAAATFAGGGSEWGGQVVLWVISLSYGGPVLVRGQQIDGPNALRFDGGLDALDAGANAATGLLLADLRLLPIDHGDGLPWGTALAYTRVRAPGCYAYQIDGLRFSYTVIFAATPNA